MVPLIRRFFLAKYQIKKNVLFHFSCYYGCISFYLSFMKHLAKFNSVYRAIFSNNLLGRDVNGYAIARHRLNHSVPFMI